MRLLTIGFILLFIFYLGVQAGQPNVPQENRTVYQSEDDLLETRQSSITFVEKHQAILLKNKEHQDSKVFGIAIFLEDIIKTFFTALFNFFYRFSAMFF